MKDNTCTFYYANPLVYLLLLVPMLALPLLLLRLLLQQPAGGSLVLGALLGITAFFGGQAVLNRLLYPWFTYRGSCLLAGDRVELSLRFSRVALGYGEIRRVAFVRGRISTCLVITTKWRSYAVEQSGQEGCYPDALPIRELCRMLEERWQAHLAAGSVG